MGGSCNCAQVACRVLDGDSLLPTRMRVTGSVIWPEAERNYLPRRSPFGPCRLLPEDGQVWPRIPEKGGWGVERVASLLLERWPGPEGTGSQDTGDCLLLAQPSPAWEEVLPSALGWLYC